MIPASILRVILCSVPVAPLPPSRTVFNRWLTTNIDDLLLDTGRYATLSWLAKSLDLAITVQNTAIAKSLDETNHSALNDYLDGTINLLDACSAIRDRIADVRSYASSLSTACRRLDVGREPSMAVLARAKSALDACKGIEKRFANPPKCRLPRNVEVGEALSGARAMAVVVIMMVGSALSLKDRRRIPTVGWGKSWTEAMNESCRGARELAIGEVESAVAAARELRVVVGRQRGLPMAAGEVKCKVEELKRRSGELEGMVKVIGERVDELYKGLISIRVVLLGLLSMGC